MATGDITLTLEKREVIGKQVRALRRSGTTPAVIHNHGKDSIIVNAPSVEMAKVYQAAGKHHPVDLKVGDEKYLAIIKEVDFDPRKNTLRHVVFDAVHQNEQVQTEVPIRLEGDSAAEKAGLMLLPQLEQVKVEAVPRSLPDELTISIEALAEIGDKLTVGDLTAPEGVTIITDPEHPIVSVIETPAQQSEEAEAEAAEAGETGEQGEEAAADSKESDES